MSNVAVASDLANIQSHTVLAHPESSAAKQEIGTLECNICGFMAKSRNVLKIHAKVVHSQVRDGRDEDHQEQDDLLEQNTVDFQSDETGPDADSMSAELDDNTIPD